RCGGARDSDGAEGGLRAWMTPLGTRLHPPQAQEELGSVLPHCTGGLRPLRGWVAPCAPTPTLPPARRSAGDAVDPPRAGGHGRRSAMVLDGARGLTDALSARAALALDAQPRLRRGAVRIGDDVQ